MANPIITGAVLVDANGAALNNAGMQESELTGNKIAVKQIRVGRNRYPYVSGQAWRRWWREVLYADFGWTPSPVIREAKQAYTEANPIQYEDDDLFGYMSARKKETYRRVSPVKNSLLVSVLPNVITSHFESFSRNLPADTPDPIPFEHEHYTTLLQGTFTIALAQVGRFEQGAMRDLAPDIAPPAGATVHPGNPKVIVLSRDERVRRVQQCLEGLARLRGGAMLTRNNTDVAPVVVLVGILDGGNAPFQNLFTTDEVGERVMLNLERLRSVVRDYREQFLGDRALWFGYRPGVLANEAEVLSAFEAGLEGVPVRIGDPAETLRQVAQQVAQVMPE